MITNFLTLLQLKDDELLLSWFKGLSSAELEQLAGFRNQGMNIIHYLVEEDKAEVLAYLYDKVPSALFTEKGERTPFELALICNSKKVVTFFTEKNIAIFLPFERETFYGELTVPLENPEILLQNRSLLKAAVSAGETKVLEILLPQFLSLEAVKADKNLRIDYLKSCVFIAIQNKNLPCVSILMNHLSLLLTAEEMFDELAKTTEGTDFNWLKRIDKRHENGLTILKMLFSSEDFNKIKHKLILQCVRFNYPKLLPKLLAEITEEKEIIDLLSEVLPLVLDPLFHSNTRQDHPNAFLATPDILDIVAQHCSKNFDKAIITNADKITGYLGNIVEKNNVIILARFLQGLSKEGRAAILSAKVNGLTLHQIAVKQKALDVVKVLEDYGAKTNGVLANPMQSPYAYLQMVGEIITNKTVTDDQMLRLITAIRDGFPRFSPPDQKNPLKFLFKVMSIALKTNVNQSRELFKWISWLLLIDAQAPLTMIELYLHNRIIVTGLFLGETDIISRHLDYIANKSAELTEFQYLRNSLPERMLMRLVNVFYQHTQLVLPVREQRILSNMLDLDIFSIRDMVGLLPSIGRTNLNAEQLYRLNSGIYTLDADKRKYVKDKLTSSFHNNDASIGFYCRTYMNVVQMFEWLNKLEEVLCPEAQDYKAHFNDLDKILAFLKAKISALYYLHEILVLMHADLKKNTYSQLLEQIKLQLNKTQTLCDEVEKHLNNRTDFRLPEPILKYHFILSLKNGDINSFKYYLASISDTDLMKIYQNNNILVADYIADVLIRKNHLALFVEFFNRIKSTPNQKFLQRLLPLAIKYNQVDIIEFLKKQPGISFASEYFRQAFEGSLAETDEQTVSLVDGMNVALLPYAVSGGHSEVVRTLRGKTPLTFVTNEFVLMRCLYSRNLGLVQELISNISPDKFLRIIPDLLLIIIDCYDNPIQIIHQILTFVDEKYKTAFIKKFAIAAASQSKQILLHELINGLNESERLSLFTYLMDNLPGATKKIGSPEITKTHLSKNHKFVHHLTAYLSKELSHSPEVVIQVLFKFYLQNNLPDMREFLAVLPDTVIFAALNLVVKPEGQAPINLIQLAINKKQFAFVGLLMSRGLDKNPISQKIIKQFTGDVKERTLNANEIEKVSENTLLEKHRYLFLSLLRKMIAGDDLTEDALDQFIDSVEDSLNNNLYVNYCVGQLSDTLVWACCQSYKKINTPIMLALFDKLVGYTRTNPHLFYRFANLSVGRKDLEASGKYLHWMEYAVCQMEKPNYSQMLKALHAKLTNALMYAFNLPLTSFQQKVYKNSWDVMNLDAVFGSAIIPFIKADRVKLNIATLRHLKALAEKFHSPGMDIEINETGHLNELVEEVESIVSILSFIRKLEERLLQESHITTLEKIQQKDLLLQFYDTILIALLPIREVIFDLSGHCLKYDVPVVQLGAAVADIRHLYNAGTAFKQSYGEEMSKQEQHIRDKERQEKLKQSLKASGKDKRKNQQPKKEITKKDSEEETSDEEVIGSPVIDRNELPALSSFRSPYELLDENMVKQHLDAVSKPEFKQRSVRKPVSFVNQSAKPLSKKTAKPHSSSAPATPVTQAMVTKSSSKQVQIQLTKPLPSLVDESKHVVKRMSSSTDIKSKSDFPDLASKERNSESQMSSASLLEVLLPTAKPVTVPVYEQEASKAASSTPSIAPSIVTRSAPLPAKYNGEMLEPIKVVYDYRQIPEIIRYIARFFGAAGVNQFNALLTGGVVRNCEMGLPIDGLDFDFGIFNCDFVTIYKIVTILKPVLSDVFQINISDIEISKDDNDYCVTLTIKTEHGELKVDFVDETRAERDFSPNAMYWHPDFIIFTNKGVVKPGNIIWDPYHGKQAIAKHNLTFAFPDPDYVRNQRLIFRTIRFESQFGFTLDPLTVQIKAEASIPSYAEVIYKWKNLNTLLAESNKTHAAFKNKDGTINTAAYHQRLKFFGMYDALVARRVIIPLITPAEPSSASLKQ